MLNLSKSVANYLVKVALFFLIFSSGLLVVKAEDLPTWLSQIASTKTTQSLAKNVPALVLLKEQRVIVNNDGKITVTEIGAIRILTRDGSKEASVAVAYLTDGSKVQKMQAWLLSPNGDLRKYEKDEIIDQAAALNDVYNETRIKFINASSSASEGEIFAYEWTVEQKAFVNQDSWVFQDNLPTVLSRYSLALPQGWSAESFTFNHPKIEPTIKGNVYVWELKELSFIELEQASPSFVTLVPRIAISYFPPEGSRIGASFSSWVEVSKWLSQLADPQAIPDDAIKSKTLAITSNAKTEYEQIGAVAKYVQNTQYISIQSNIARGGGYKPHAATEVFAKSYGDCKDKANLMRAMLKSININAYPLVIYSGDPTHVRNEWPSPHQFNHCIVAVSVKENNPAKTIVLHPTLGKLLVFDPTDDITPIGDLPSHEQNSFALLVAGDAGVLMRMPETEPESNSLFRINDLVLTADGSISGSIKEHSTGQAARQAKAEFRALAKPDYQKTIEEWVINSIAQAKITKLEPVDFSNEGKFDLTIEINAPRYGQLMQNRLLVFKPSALSKRRVTTFTQTSRKLPIMLKQEAFTEIVKVRLPEGFIVDELPDSIKLETTFGTYVSNYEFKEGYLFGKQSLILRTTNLSSQEYSTVRKFFEQVHNAEQVPVVLLKK